MNRVHCTSFWSAPAERSGDGPLVGSEERRQFERGVALRLPPHSKTLSVYRRFNLQDWTRISAGANQVLEECLFLESQRDSATKPRVARNELPWVTGAQNNNPNGVAIRGVRSPKPKPRWGFVFQIRCPRVARSSQPWALGHNPFGIGRLSKADLRSTAQFASSAGRASSRAGLSTLRSSAEQYGSARNTATEDRSVASPTKLHHNPAFLLCLLSVQRMIDSE